MKPNLSYIDTLAGDDKVFKQHLISIVKKELPLEVEVYQRNLLDKKYKDVAENVHKLKHKISILGMEKAYYLAVDYEEELKNNDASQQAAFEAILESMSQFVNQL
jgi:hypothetical protein